MTMSEDEGHMSDKNMQDKVKGSSEVSFIFYLTLLDSSKHAVSLFKSYPSQCEGEPRSRNFMQRRRVDIFGAAQRF